jgi:hypothetical protein
MKVVIERTIYKGKATVTIRKDTVELDPYPLSFGVVKAKLLVQALKQEPDFIEKFINEESE